MLFNFSLKFLTFAYLSVTPQSKDDCFTETPSKLGPMFIPSHLGLAPASAPGTVIFSTAALATSTAAWVSFCHCLYICYLLHVLSAFKIPACLFFLIFLPTLDNVTCLSSDNTSGCFRCVFIACFYGTINMCS